MKKSFPILLIFLLCSAMLAGCSCQHTWADATCEAAKTCTTCNLTEGEALGHSWIDADCVAPKTCSRCNLTEGKPLGHTWTEATCTSPKTCSTCSITEGQPLEHTWEGEATLYTAPHCSVCNAEGEPLPGYFTQNGLIPNVRANQAADYITSTYVRPDLNTTGQFFASDVMVFQSDAAHRAKKGYEWRSVDIIIRFNENRAGLYGTNVTYARTDFYQEQALKQVKKQERFSVTYNGKEYNCIATFENVGYAFESNSYMFRMTCIVQVPIGYDGVILAFYHGNTEIDGMHPHEVEDENTLLFRMA